MTVAADADTGTDWLGLASWWGLSAVAGTVAGLRVFEASVSDTILATVIATGALGALGLLGKKLWGLWAHPVVTIRTRGNTATESWARWYHVEVVSERRVAMQPTVTVLVRESMREHEEWSFSTNPGRLGLTPVLIPLVVGNMTENPMTLIGPEWRLKTRMWYLTPDADRKRGDELMMFRLGHAYHFEVRVRWIQNGQDKQTEAVFRLAFTKDGPEFSRV